MRIQTVQGDITVQTDVEAILPEVEVVDEMLAILSDRNAIIKKKETEQAQAKINELYRFGLDIE